MFQLSVQYYSKGSIIRSGCSRLLEFEKNIVLAVCNRSFIKKIQTRTFNTSYLTDSYTGESTFSDNYIGCLIEPFEKISNQDI
jgi:hypothetical protein